MERTGFQHDIGKPAFYRCAVCGARLEGHGLTVDDLAGLHRDECPAPAGGPGP